MKQVRISRKLRRPAGPADAPLDALPTRAVSSTDAAAATLARIDEALAAR